MTLNGTARSRPAKRHAEDLAERVSGVGYVQNNLRLQARATVLMGAGRTTGAPPRSGSGDDRHAGRDVTAAVGQAATFSSVG
ncbi:BON domain-containing protein [Inquilinus limosus]|uniref:BON domain-containing protein n=1 Tax=Inquilinus limosus TaxID=171674 RepID=UPI003F5CE6DF